MRYLLIIVTVCFYDFTNVMAGEDSGSDPDCLFSEVYGLLESASYERAIEASGELLPGLADRNHRGEAFFCIAYANERSGRLFEAIQFYNKAAEEYTAELCLSNTFENIGLIYKGFNQHDKAIYYFDKAVSLQKSGSHGRMKKLYSRAASLRRSDRTELALTDLLEAEEIAFQSNDNVFRAKIYNQLGLLFKFRGELGKSGSYFFRALEIAESRDIYHNYANLKLELGDTVLAEQYFLKAVDLADGPGLITTYIDMGEMYLHWRRSADARTYLGKAYDIYKPNGELSFNHIKLFELLAAAESDPVRASYFKDKAIAAYRTTGADLKKSKDLFFGAIADEKVRMLETKRAHADSSEVYQLIIVIAGLITLVLLGWLILRIRRSAKDKKIKKVFEEIRHIFYEE